MIDGAAHPVSLVVTDDLRRSRLTVFFRASTRDPALPLGGFCSLRPSWSSSSSSGACCSSEARRPRGSATSSPASSATRRTSRRTCCSPRTRSRASIRCPPRPTRSTSRSTRRHRRAAGRRSSGSSSRSRRSRSAASSSSAGRAAAATSRAAWPSLPRSCSGGSALILGRAPRGLRDLVAYCIGYGAQLSAYLFLVTDRYPYSGPNAYVSAREDDEPHPVRMTVTDDLRRSRLLVLFRLPLAIPHIVWLVLWAVVACPPCCSTWLCALVTGRAPRPFHRFLVRATALLDSPVRVPLPRRQPVPGLRRDARQLPGRPRARSERAAEAARHALPLSCSRSRRSWSPAGSHGALWTRRHPRLVRRALPGPDAGRPPQPRRLRAPLLGPVLRLSLPPDGPVSGQRAAARSRLSVADLRRYTGRRGAFV